MRGGLIEVEIIIACGCLPVSDVSEHKRQKGEKRGMEKGGGLINM